MAVVGKVSKLEVSTDGGVVFTPVLGRMDQTLNLTKAEIDVSDMDGGGWAEFLDGRKDWTVDGTLRYNEDDPGQAVLIDNYFADPHVNLDVRFIVETGTGKNQFSGKAFVSSLAPAPTDEAPTDNPITLRGTGALTKGAQA